MPTKTHGERLDRLEQVVGLLAEGQIALEKVVPELAAAMRRGFDQVAAQFAESAKRREEDRARTDERFREIDELFRETDRRFRETDALIQELARENAQRSRVLDERIEKLVIAIGEIIRTQPPRE